MIAPNEPQPSSLIPIVIGMMVICLMVVTLAFAAKQIADIFYQNQSSTAINP